MVRRSRHWSMARAPQSTAGARSRFSLFSRPSVFKTEKTFTLSCTYTYIQQKMILRYMFSKHVGAHECLDQDHGPNYYAPCRTQPDISSINPLRLTGTTKFVPLTPYARVRLLCLSSQIPSSLQHVRDRGARTSAGYPDISCALH